MPKVSVVIPVWNAGVRIRRCLDSLLSQTLQDIEIVCVLDCPTDGTDRIVEEYAQRDPRIVVVRNEKNLKISESRNRGISVSKGEYVGFCDHDDYCSCEMFESLYAEAEKTDADVVSSDAIFRSEDGLSSTMTFSDLSRDAVISSIIQPMEISRQKMQLTHCVWHSIYRSAFLRDRGIRFPDRDKYIDEDKLFNLQVYLDAAVISHVDKAFYIWDRRGDSTSSLDWDLDIPSRSIDRLDFILDALGGRKDVLMHKKSIHQLIAFDLSLFQAGYACLPLSLKIRFAAVLRFVRYPIWYCGDYRIRMVGRKHLRMMKYLLGLRFKY